jgi:NAD(P)-dependent dehydrogenase (short-subunit alcohol dehydrogenase family)
LPNDAHPENQPVALITGAGSGIGRAIAVQLSALGYACVLCGRREWAIKQTSEMLSTDSHVIAADLSQAADVERMIDEAIAWRGRIDALINNAGWSPSATIEQTDANIIGEVFAVNAVAPALAIARLWPSLLARARESLDRGTSPPRVTIVNISSMAVHDPFPQLYAYAAAKAATHLLARSAAKEGLPWNIRAFAVAPGAVETDLLRSLISEDQLPHAMTLSPDDVARQVVACVRGDHDAMNGQVIWLPSPSP